MMMRQQQQQVQVLHKNTMKFFLFLSIAVVQCHAGWTDTYRYLPRGDSNSGQKLLRSNLRVDHSSSSQAPSSDTVATTTPPLPLDYFTTRGSDLQKYLNPSLSQAALDTIAEQLSNGKVVVIRNALDPQLAEAVYQELYQAEYAVDQDYHASGSHYHYHRLLRPRPDNTNTDGATSNAHSALNKTMTQLFNGVDTKRWMSGLSNRDCMGDATVKGEYFANGDHSLPTTDFIYQRTVAFDWHLSKDWKPEYGGAFYWCQEAAEHAYIPPSFNTLILYSVNQDTSHFVTPVTTPESNHNKRLSLSGWWNSNWIPKADDNYEEILTTWKNNMTEFQYMAINFVISSDSFDAHKKQRVEPLLLEVQQSQVRGYEGSYEFGEEGEHPDDEEEEEEEQWESRDLSEGDL